MQVAMLAGYPESTLRGVVTKLGVREGGQRVRGRMAMCVHVLQQHEWV